MYNAKTKSNVRIFQKDTIQFCITLYHISLHRIVLHCRMGSQTETSVLAPGAVRGEARWKNTSFSNAMQCNAMQCNAMQCNAMQCCHDDAANIWSLQPSSPFDPHIIVLSDILIPLSFFACGNSILMLPIFELCLHLSSNLIWFCLTTSWLVAETFIWLAGWVLGGLALLEGTHRREFLRENMNGGAPLFQLSLQPLIQHEAKPERGHAGTQVNPLECQKKEASMWLISWYPDMQRDSLKHPVLNHLDQFWRSCETDQCNSGFFKMVSREIWENDSWVSDLWP